LDSSIEDPGPVQPVSGRTIEMRLDEHPYRKRFSATIVGPVLVAGEPYYDGMYLLKLNPNVSKKLSLDHILFLPQWYDFRRGLLIRVGRVPKGPYRVSLERFLFSRNPAIRALGGRVYTTLHLKELTKTMSFQATHEFSMLSYGFISRPKTAVE